MKGTCSAFLAAAALAILPCMEASAFYHIRGVRAGESHPGKFFLMPETNSVSGGQLLMSDDTRGFGFIDPPYGTPSNRRLYWWDFLVPCDAAFERWYYNNLVGYDPDYSNRVFQPFDHLNKEPPESEWPTMDIGGKNGTFLTDFPFDSRLKLATNRDFRCEWRIASPNVYAAYSGARSYMHDICHDSGYSTTFPYLDRPYLVNSRQKEGDDLLMGWAGLANTKDQLVYAVTNDFCCANLDWATNSPVFMQYDPGTGLLIDLPLSVYQIGAWLNVNAAFSLLSYVDYRELYPLFTNNFAEISSFLYGDDTYYRQSYDYPPYRLRARNFRWLEAAYVLLDTYWTATDWLQPIPRTEQEVEYIKYSSPSGVVEFTIGNLLDGGGEDNPDVIPDEYESETLLGPIYITNGTWKLVRANESPSIVREYHTNMNSAVWDIRPTYGKAFPAILSISKDFTLPRSSILGFANELRSLNAEPNAVIDIVAKSFNRPIRYNETTHRWEWESTLKLTSSYDHVHGVDHSLEIGTIDIDFDQKLVSWFWNEVIGQHGSEYASYYATIRREHPNMLPFADIGHHWATNGLSAPALYPAASVMPFVGSIDLQCLASREVTTTTNSVSPRQYKMAGEKGPPMGEEGPPTMSVLADSVTQTMVDDCQDYANRLTADQFERDPSDFAESALDELVSFINETSGTPHFVAAVNGIPMNVHPDGTIELEIPPDSGNFVVDTNLNVRCAMGVVSGQWVGDEYSFTNLNFRCKLGCQYSERVTWKYSNLPIKHNN